ncbi:MAG: hypothetical protein IPK93_01725 [Solirubrobacterales bacterium]|nr:hypothetical protein [Solirubrobacterales bacterium]
MWFAVEVLIYGSFFVYVLAVFPAALVSVLKRRWIPYILGFFTFGLAWFYGAIDIARPASWWAGKFYPAGPQQDTRQFEEVRKKRVLKGGMIAFAAVILIGLFAARPTPVLGTDGKTLQGSVDGFLAFADTCRKGPGDDWTCFAYDNASSGDAPYRTTVDWAGCWNAEADGNGRRPTNPELSGCVTIFDHLNIIARIFG